MNEIEDVEVEKKPEEVSYIDKKMTRKFAVILFAGLLTLLILVFDEHRDFNLLLTSRFIQVLFVLSYATLIFRFMRFKDNKLLREIVDTASIIQVFLLLFSIANFQFISISTVEGSSMEPSFYQDDNILISHMDGTYERFDVVVIKMEEKVYYIKRVIGLPGDFIEIIDNQLFVNGYIQDQDFLQDETGEIINNTLCDVFGETRCSFIVPEGEYFVLGDNRESSEDSRVFGNIAYQQIEGIVIYRFKSILD